MSFNRALLKNAQHVGSKRLGPGELKFNVINCKLIGRVFPQTYIDDIRYDPHVAIGYGPDDARHELRVSVVNLPDGATLKIGRMDAMRQNYGWDDNTPLSVYHYTSGTRSARGGEGGGDGGGGGVTHNFIFIVEEAGAPSNSCKGCGVNM